MSSSRRNSHKKLEPLLEILDGAMDVTDVDNDADVDVSRNSDVSVVGIGAIVPNIGKKRGRSGQQFSDDADDDAMMISGFVKSGLYASPPMSPIKQADSGETNFMHMGIRHLNFEDDDDMCDNLTDDACCSRSLTSADSSSFSLLPPAMSYDMSVADMLPVKAKIVRPLPDQSAFDQCFTDKSNSSFDSLMSMCPPTPIGKISSANRNSARRNRSVTSNMGNWNTLLNARPRSSSEGDVLSPTKSAATTAATSALSEEDARVIPLDGSQVFCRCDNASCTQSISFREDFSIIGLIGKGVFAEVYSVRDNKKSFGSEEIYAIKKLIHPSRTRKDRELKLREANILFSLKEHQEHHCPYIINFFACWQENECLHFLTELASRGSLSAVMEYVRSPLNTSSHVYFPDDFLWQFLHNVANGLVHIHSHGYVHLDIKPANLFITAAGVVKIGDFGRSVKAGMGEDGQEGDESYMAPELLTSFFRHPSADIFSLGITLLELVNVISNKIASPSSSSSSTSTSIVTRSLKKCCINQLPSNGPLWHKLRNDCDEFIPSRVSRAIRRVIISCMKVNYLQRCSANDILHLNEVNLIGASVGSFLVDLDYNPNLNQSTSWSVPVKTNGIRRLSSFEALEAHLRL